MTFNAILDFFMSSAYAASAAPAANAPQQGGGLNFFFIMLLVLAGMYLMVIRPQNKRAKEQRNLIGSVAKGDEVVTIGGLMGRINKVSDTYIKLEIADNMEVTLQKSAISTILPKGTLKSI